MAKRRRLRRIALWNAANKKAPKQEAAAYGAKAVWAFYLLALPSERVAEDITVPMLLYA